MPRLDWDSAKARFNHDWLKNRACIAINALIRQSRCQAESALTNLSQLRVFEEWTDRRLEALTLIDRFPLEMSPAIYFKQSPLCFCEASTQTWLIPVILDIWRDECGVGDWIDSARSAVVRVDATLAAALESYMGTGGENRHPMFDPQALSDLADAMAQLSDVMSNHPRSLP